MIWSIRRLRPRATIGTALFSALLLAAVTPTAATAAGGNKDVTTRLSAVHAGRSGGQAAVASPPAPSAADPTVSGPIPDPSSIILPLASYPLASKGYHKSEFFFSGSANAYMSAVPLNPDGQWTVTPASSAPYESRLVVVAPDNPAKFSGHVIVEWLNVSAGTDAAPDWLYNHDEILRSGDVYVGISAQAVGINAIKAADPARYGALSSPGDSYSYDIFSQGGMALRDDAARVLPGLNVRDIIAEGDSQSASRLVTYIDAVAPLTHVYDGYLLHSRGTSGAALSQAPQPTLNPPSVTKMRTDQSTPVLTFETETDVAAGLFNYFPATQDDSNIFRLWEVAGTSHLDSRILTLALQDDGSFGSVQQAFGQMFNPPTTENTVGNFTCPVPFNTGEESYVENAAVHDLAAWARTGTPPPSMPRFDVLATTPTSYQVDANGNVVGGVRTPAVDAPVATLNGMPSPGAPGFCILFGQTHPFSAEKLQALYPTHGSFVSAWDRAVNRDQRAGYLLPADAASLRRAAAGAPLF